MRFLKILFIFQLSILIPLSGNAQIAAPDFSCIKNDSLFWDFTNDFCGPFEQYVIYFSQNENGPYTILATVTDVNQTFFQHPNPAGNEYFYYITIERDCPGESPTPSDTLNNRPPRVGPIISVGVDGTGVRITWEASTSPETSSYIIYRIEDNGTFPIDTVSGALTYLDDTADFTSQTESYFVVALDDCENNSIFGDAHNSIFLNASVDPCTQSITLNWNPYDDWMQGVDRQEIWLTDGTIPPSKIEELSPGLDTYTLNGIVDNQTYIINIRAVQADDEAVYSDSNPIVLRPDVIEPVRELTAYYLCTNMDNSISVFWNWNAGAELQEFSVCRTDQEDQVVVESITINLPTGEEEVFQDVNANGAEEIYTYDIKTIDLCDSMNISNKISNIVLTVDQVDNSSNQIVWTDFFMERGTLKFYDLFRTQNGQGVHLGTFGPGETEFLDVYDAEAFSDEVFFYYVTATAEVEQVDGTAVDASVKSNLARLEKVAYIIAPNAFVPTGKNNVFKPVLFNRNSLQVFEMKIWDRWGQLIFQSSDPNVGWDGRKDGRFLPKGVYAYVVEMTMKNGDETIDRGSVLLLK